MTLRKLSTPGINPGGVDKLYGEDWNRLIDALTGGVAENVTLLGTLAVTRAGTDGVARLKNTNTGGLDVYFHVGETARYANKWKISDNSDVTLGNLYLDFNSSGYVAIRQGARLVLDGSVDSGDTYIVEGASNRMDFFGGGTRWLMLGYNDGIVIPSTKKLFLDDGGDTYIQEIGANQMALVVGGTERLRVHGGNQSIEAKSSDIVIDATKRLYLDGGGDTYLAEISANKIRAISGGSTGLTIQSAAVSIGDGQKLEMTGDGNNDYFIGDFATRTIKLFINTVEKFTWAADKFSIPAAAKLYLDGGGDTYIREVSANVVDIFVGGVQMVQVNTTHWDFNQKIWRNPKNSANTAVSGTPRTVELDIGGTPYYFLAYPTSSA